MAHTDGPGKPGARPQTGVWSEVPAHENSDVNLSGLGMVLALLVGGAFVIHIALWWWANTPGPENIDEGAQRPVLASRLSESQKSFPQLQLYPSRDFEEFLAQEEQRLRGARPAQRTNRFEQPSIERAMVIVAERGLPGWRGEGAPPISPAELQRQRSATREKDVP